MKVTHLRKKDVIKSSVKGIGIEFDHERLATILGVPSRNGICEYIKEVWEESKYTKPLDITRRVANDETIIAARRVKSSEMKPFQRFIHFLVMKNVIPRFGKRDTSSFMDLTYMDHLMARSRPSIRYPSSRKRAERGESGASAGEETTSSKEALAESSLRAVTSGRGSIRRSSPCAPTTSIRGIDGQHQLQPRGDLSFLHHVRLFRLFRFIGLFMHFRLLSAVCARLFPLSFRHLGLHLTGDIYCKEERNESSCPSL
ncbi:hypothetical protein Dimus_011162 [Dionaea muscipula]